MHSALFVASYGTDRIGWGEFLAFVDSQLKDAKHVLRLAVQWSCHDIAFVNALIYIIFSLSATTGNGRLGALCGKYCAGVPTKSAGALAAVRASPGSEDHVAQVADGISG